MPGSPAATGAMVAFTSVSGKEHYSQYCPKTTDRKYIFNEEMNIHLKENPYACPYCAYRTYKSSNLKSHIRIHTGEKPFVCSQCPFRAAQKVNLKRHIRKHSK